MLSMLNHVAGTSLVAQWQRICLPVQETPVQPLIQEDPLAADQPSRAPQLLSLFSSAQEPRLLACS